RVKLAPTPLYTQWDAAKTRANAADQNLSYHATEFNLSDEMIRQPLLYDLEPYNFLRVEGHVGQFHTAALDSVTTQRGKYRLPIDVIELSTDARSLRMRLVGNPDAKNTRAGCYFRDLEALYTALEKHLICFLCKEMKYYYELPNSEAAPGAATLAPTPALLKACDPDFRYAPNTHGQAFEDWYARMNKTTFITADNILSTSAFATFQPLLARLREAPAGTRVMTGDATAANTGLAAGINTNAAATAGISLNEMTFAVAVQFLLFILYYIEQLFETLKGSLAALDIDTFVARFNDLQKVATAYRGVLAGLSGNLLTLRIDELLEHLDKLIYACDPSEFRSLAAELEKRWRTLEALRRLAFYARKCPGLQHKAGVPVGGTFVIVYHEKPSTDVLSTRIIKEGDRGDAVFDKLLVDLEKEDAATKSDLDELIQNIPDGTVIADFYYPFICCSDCPPIQYDVRVVEPAPPQDPVTISITPAEFCNDNKGPIPITVSPPGGTIQGEGAGPVTPSGFAFVPASVDVGDLNVKEVEIIYTVNDTGASTKVKVYHEPIASFTLARNPTVGPGHVDAVDASKFAEKYSWDFGDGTPAVTTQKASHDYTKSGTYVVTLTVTNGTCTAKTPFSIEILLEAPVARQCLPVKTPADDFKNLPQIDPGPFAAFKTQIATYPDIEKFIGNWVAAGNLSQADEVEFYLKQGAVALLEKTIRATSDLIARNVDLRTLALEFFRIQLEITMRIACVQDEDIDVAKAKTSTVFEVVNGAVGQWTALAQQTSAAGKQRIKAVLDNVQTEANRLKGDEAAKKKNYTAALNAILKVLKVYPF
ncbi:MAG TPA: PKD domain-containing protein, partial [Verrucomicrobiae bacterium]|nr:PKD domain-containing protein [Verrucomicrobiae bacterium]